MRFTVLPYRRFNAAANMAVDAGMISFAAERQAVCFRFYGWSEPAVTFGYSQAATVAEPNGALSRVRRETGGGLVDHRDDLTYALAIPRAHPAWSQPPAEIYRAVHDSLKCSFQEWGVAAELAPCPQTGACDAPSRLAPCCFTAAAPGDVIEATTGRKFAGAALRRHASALLLQGSITRAACLPMLDLAAWRRRFPALLAATLDCSPPTLAEQWPDALPAPAVVERFTSDAWNFKR